MKNPEQRFPEEIDALWVNVHLATMTSGSAYGMVKEGALADLILVNGNPLENLDLVADPKKNFVIIMKDGKIYKNTL